MERDFATLQEMSGHHKKRSAEILSMLLRDLSEIGSIVGTSDLKAVRPSDLHILHLSCTYKCTYAHILAGALISCYTVCYVLNYIDI